MSLLVSLFIGLGGDWLTDLGIRFQVFDIRDPIPHIPAEFEKRQDSAAFPRLRVSVDSCQRSASCLRDSKCTTLSERCVAFYIHI